MNENLKPSAACRAIICDAEQRYLKAYLCPAGVPTIGWGHTRGVRMGDTCSVEQADMWLTEDMADAVGDVQHLVTVPLSQGQFDALVSFTHNLGFKRLAGSTLLKLLNAGDYRGAWAQFHLWCHADGKELPGLVKRRQAEADLFLKGTA